MLENKNKQSVKSAAAAEPPRHETQRERWLKYGGNVALTAVVVVALGALVVFVAEKLGGRIDTTAAGLYSLKPQTVELIRKNEQPIRIVSLYTRTAPERTEREEEEEQGDVEGTDDRVQLVSDLLDEYARKGRNISVETIDPVAQPLKVEALIKEVTEKYGGEVAKYRAVMEQYPPVYQQLKKLAEEQRGKVRALPSDVPVGIDLFATLMSSLQTVQDLPATLEETEKQIDRLLKQKPPGYKRASEVLADDMARLLTRLDRVIEDFKRFSADKEVPEAFRAYMGASLPAYEQMKKLATDLQGKVKALGELKLDDLKQSLKERNTILVMGKDEMRVLPFRRVFERPDEVRNLTPGRKLPRRFAGEQQVTSAILSLTSKVKPKVVLVRSGGPPQADAPMSRFRPPGPFYELAERLRLFNFEVVEKDLSGAPPRGPMMTPEPSDEEIKDAIWIVVATPDRPDPMTRMPPAPIAPKVAEHLARGKPVLMLVAPEVGPVGSALEPWGVTVRSDLVAVKEPVRSDDPPSDVVDQVLRMPPFFVLRDFGDHLVTRPVRSLEGLFFFITPIEISAIPGFRATRILPVPQDRKVWGESNVQAVMEMEEVRYDPPAGASRSGDVQPPLWGGAIVEKEGGGRLVVLGSIHSFINQILLLPDTRTEQYVTRFPANTELILNSVFWLSGQETLISISPAAMEVNRVTDMSDAASNVWRIGVLLILLPGAVLAFGLVTYFRRRD